MSINGATVTISWDIQNIDIAENGVAVLLLGGEGETIAKITESKGSIDVTPKATTSYSVSITRHGQKLASNETTIHTATISLLQNQIISGQTTKISWDFSGVETIVIEPFGEVPAKGEENISPTENILYTVKVPGHGDNVTVSLALMVIDPVSLDILASKDTGASPLEVRFSPIISNNNIVVTSYKWDFDSDGTVDASDGFGKPQTYTFVGAPGDEVSVSLTAIPAQGDPVVAKKIITLEGSPPTVQVSPSLTNGHVPLDVGFTVRAQDRDGIEVIRIDYEGDGIFDDEQDGFGYTSQNKLFYTQYTEEGSYEAIVQVVDIHGIATNIANRSIEVDANNPLDPVVGLSAVSYSGNAPLTLTLNASASLYDSDQVTKWEWDLDGDGSFETSGGTETTDSQEVTFDHVNHYYPAVKVTTSTNRTAVASRWIEATMASLPTVTIDDENDTVDIDDASEAAFNVGLPFPTDMAVWIEDLFGRKVKQIQEENAYEIGDYSFTWDLTDDQGKAVPVGDYYVVMSYAAYEDSHTLDLRETTGGTLTYYRRKENNPRFFNRLESPLVINYEVDDPAEISFFWQVSFGDRLMTLLEHERMGRGYYTMYWNGDYPSGKKVDGSLLLMPGIVRYTLPDNVIFVKEAPRIDDFQLTSTVISDPRREPIGINLSLSKASTVELVVADMEKGVDVSTRVYSGLAAGLHELAWDGKNNDDQYLAPGDYRIGVRSVDDSGSRSMYWFRTQQIQY